MNFDSKTGSIDFDPALFLRPRMLCSEVLALPIKWEEWMIVDGVTHSYRALLKLPNKGMSSKTILIVHVGPGTNPLGLWTLSPWDLIEGKQSRPEGKCTKRLRIWFQEMFGVKLPVKGEWGDLDACYDPWNQTTSVVCNYVETTGDRASWEESRQFEHLSRA